jgi:hypothetical protein
MINTFAWALPPRKEYEFEVLMRKSIRAALGLPKEELASVRRHLYQGSNGEAPAEAGRSRSARELSQGLSRFLQPEIPGYWQSIARTYYDHYIFQLNGQPVSAYPERHTRWATQEAPVKQRLRQWYRFTRGVLQMAWRRRRANGIVP